MQPIYTTRRGATRTKNVPTTPFARNHNTVRLKRKGLGPMAQYFLIGMMVMIAGLFYLTQSTQATSYDYEISGVESDLTEMNAKKDDLAVEQARLNSIATAKNSTVAANMEDATVSGYVAN